MNDDDGCIRFYFLFNLRKKEIAIKIFRNDYYRIGKMEKKYMYK